MDPQLQSRFFLNGLCHTFLGFVHKISQLLIYDCSHTPTQHMQTLTFTYKTVCLPGMFGNLLTITHALLQHLEKNIYSSLTVAGGCTQRAPPKDTNYFVLTYKFYET